MPKTRSPYPTEFKEQLVVLARAGAGNMLVAVIMLIFGMIAAGLLKTALKEANSTQPLWPREADLQ